ncbi:HAD family hydrolase [Williamsia herbipolensis]|uniref:HAD family hydrolase n=1 Tax=Williamsia herbipolensis TaxID=1603258 RepID=A0AAU4K3Z2_9NOCA|nr:HAD family hydrolase [Williamsia herbipolensis]
MTTVGPTDLIATDLDRTLIYSAAAAGVADPDDPLAMAEFRCVELYRGAPQSFMSPAAVDLLAELDTLAVVVPTTTRSVEQFRRVDLPLDPGRRPRYAVAANGGEILLDGVADPAWRTEVEKRLSTACAPVDEVYDHLAADSEPTWLTNLRIADGLFCYAVVDLPSMPDDLVSRWRTWAEQRGWNVSRQGRKIYVVPDPLTKASAIEAIGERYLSDRPRRVFAAGDGVLDTSMLVAADRSIRPRHGELQELSWHHPSLSVTSSSGIAASAEILETLLVWTRTDPAPSR